MSLSAALHRVLSTPDPRAKVKAARAAARDWRRGRLAHDFAVAMPDRPVRGDRPPLLPPNRMPKRGKGRSLANRTALLHAIAHIEYVAIDLAADLVGRFGGAFPRAFADDWMRVLAEEAMHFAIVDRRLHALGAAYGDLPAHDGLWEAAEATAHDAAARLAIVPMVLEARALDVSPQTIERLESAGDAVSARLLRRILSDEIGHVAAGVRWFESIADGVETKSSDLWKSLVAQYFRGSVKPPFNVSAREAAGLTPDFYAALAAGHTPAQTDNVVREGQFQGGS